MAFVVDFGSLVSRDIELWDRRIKKMHGNCFLRRLDSSWARLVGLLKCRKKGYWRSVYSIHPSSEKRYVFPHARIVSYPKHGQISQFSYVDFTVAFRKIPTTPKQISHPSHQHSPIAIGITSSWNLKKLYDVASSCKTNTSTAATRRVRKTTIYQQVWYKQRSEAQWRLQLPPYTCRSKYQSKKTHWWEQHRLPGISSVDAGFLLHPWMNDNERSRSAGNTTGTLFDPISIPTNWDSVDETNVQSTK